jgi:FlaA1/EpsC-like NDP-sugar epimerase
MRRKYVPQIVRALMDVVAICLSWQLAVRARVALNPLGGVSFQSARPDLWAPSLAGIMALWILSALWLRLYRSSGLPTFSSIMRRSSEAAVLLGCITVIVTFFSRGNGIEISRTFVFMYVPIAFLVFTLARTAAPSASAHIDRRLRLRERIAIVGETQAALSLLNNFQQRKQSAIHVCGLIIPEIDGTNDGARIAAASSSVLGTVDRLAEHINRERLPLAVTAARFPPMIR